MRLSSVSTNQIEQEIISMKFTLTRLSVGAVALALAGCQSAPPYGAYGSARGPAPALGHQETEMHPWCGGNMRQTEFQCGQGN